MSSTVFDRDTLGSEIQTNKDKIREHKRSKERQLEEERQRIDREHYLVTTLKRKLAEQRHRYLKIGWVVMKAYWKKQSQDKRQQQALNAYLLRNERRKMRRIYMAIRKYSNQ
jgi:hypothetical protein